MWNRPAHGKDGDLEAGAQLLYPTMLEAPELRWAFIRKIYSILTVQLLLTVAVASVVVTVRPISHFFVSTSTGLVLYIFLVILPLIRKFLFDFRDFVEPRFCLLSFLYCFVGIIVVMFPLYRYYQRHPVNLILLGLFTVAISFAVGLTCAFTSGEFENPNLLLRD